MGCWQEPQLPAMWAQVHGEWALSQRLRQWEHTVSDAALQQLPEFKQRVGVLHTLGYIDEHETVQMKVCFTQVLLSTSWGCRMRGLWGGQLCATRPCASQMFMPPSDLIVWLVNL